MRTQALGILTLMASLGGCAADANYSLQLFPQVPLNQSPFDGAPEAHLRLRDSAGNVDWISLGPFGSGTREQRGLGPLQGHTLGLALGPEDPATSLTGLQAWGESSPLTASTGRRELRANLLIARLDGIGTLGSLRAPALGAAMAALRDGRIYLFGGATSGSTCSDQILKLPTLQAPSWSFSAVSERLDASVCHAVATVVEIDGREQIVLSGGEPRLGDFSNRTRLVSLFDPDTETIVWSEEGFLSRARHAVRHFSDGRLLLVGAHTSASAPTSPTWELFDPQRRRFGSTGGLPDIGPWDFMATEVPEGIAVCGGGFWADTTITPSASCVSLGPDGTTRSLPSLPVPLRAAGMTTLPDGRLLIAGGIDQASTAGSSTDGTTASYVLDPSGDEGWIQVDGLSAPRTYPRMQSDAAGGAILLGGAEAGWAFGDTPDGVATCAEGFDAQADRWAPLPGCAAAGSGLSPSVARTPGGMLFLLEGRTSASRGGEEFGVIGLGPTR
ncbi:MAG: hypothetical protein EA397_06650 [Deltaproteobacteria bacterium]|nr:MAG: hypothetical protein EA397_06650 [Deltaproteobacteria bacterium]